jgi:hypothetical protein
VATLLYMPVTVVPKLKIVADMVTAIPDAISAYSIAVAPPSSRMKRKTSVAKVVVLSFGMVFEPSGIRIITAS